LETSVGKRDRKKVGNNKKVFNFSQLANLIWGEKRAAVSNPHLSRATYWCHAVLNKVTKWQIGSCCSLDIKNSISPHKHAFATAPLPAQSRGYRSITYTIKSVKRSTGGWKTHKEKNKFPPEASSGASSASRVEIIAPLGQIASDFERRVLQRKETDKKKKRKKKKSTLLSQVRRLVRSA
jgi:hypothetical protein